MKRTSKPQATALAGRFVGLLVFGGLFALTTLDAAAQTLDGREWRQLADTTDLTWNEVAEMCPTDAATACSGAVGSTDLTQWVWASAEQVIDFMAFYEPAILTAQGSSVSGTEYFVSGLTFLGIIRYTGFAGGEHYYSEWTRGMTSSLATDGTPIRGNAGYGWWPPSGGLGVAPSGSVSSRDREGGVWMWRLIESPLDDDQDGVENALDNCQQDSNPDQRDTNSDGFGNMCDADLNNDGVINPADLGMFKERFLSDDADADLNGDGVVNPTDLSMLRGQFLGAPGPSGIAD